MSWNLQVEANYVNASFPYNSAGSFINFFEGLAYEHVNFIFADALHVQDSTYPSMHSSFYKFGLSEPGSVSYYDHSHDCVFNDHAPAMDEYDGHFETSVPMTTEQTAHVRTQLEENSGINVNTSHVECPRGNHNAHDYQVMWQDNVDPDNMTYEELLELGETVGTQSRGLSQDLISLLPVRKFKYSFFKRKKLRDERQYGYVGLLPRAAALIFVEVMEFMSYRAECVICQMEYKRGDQQMILPCKHVYHACCGATWLRINKACPICYTEVFGVEDASKH